MGTREFLFGGLFGRLCFLIEEGDILQKAPLGRWRVCFFDRVLDVRPDGALKAGGLGDRYTA